jgi:hypothetical protein
VPYLEAVPRFGASVKNWFRTHRYGPAWKPPAIIGVGLLALWEASDKGARLLGNAYGEWAQACLLVGGLGCLAWSAWKISRTPIGPERSSERPSALKGASSFGSSLEDARLFSRLGRAEQLAILRSWIGNDQVPLIVIYSESGTGKTSLLRAGLEGGAKLTSPASAGTAVKGGQEDGPASTLRLIYWEATPAGAEAGLLHAIQAQSGGDRGGPASLRAFVAQAVAERTAVLIDQAEQLSPEHHAPIFDVLARAAAAPPPYRTTWLIAMRRSYLPTWQDFELSLPKSSRSKLEYLPLQPFTVRSATEVVSTLVEESALPIDRSVVDAVIRGIVDENGRVSPVEIGISLLAMSQLELGRSSLSLRKYVDAGGLATLLATYLDGKLDRYTPREREEIGQALLRLIDSQNSQRLAAGLTAEELHTAAPAIPAASFFRALESLESPRTRVLEVVPGVQPPHYRLVHERLIPAVRRLAGPTVIALEQAQLTLDRAFSRWNLERVDRNLLSGSELRMVRARLSEIHLGDAATDKRRFVERSRGHQLLRAAMAAGIGSCVAIMVLIPFIRVAWYPEEIGNHWRRGTGFVSHTLIPPKKLWTVDARGNERSAVQWDMDTGKETYRTSGTWFVPGEKYVVVLDISGSSRAEELGSKVVTSTSAEAFWINLARKAYFTDDGGTLFWEQVTDGGARKVLRYWPLAKRAGVGALEDAEVPVIFASGSHLVSYFHGLISADPDKYRVPAVWDISHVRWDMTDVLHRDGISLLGFRGAHDRLAVGVDGEHLRAAVLREMDGNQQVLELWALNDKPRLLNTRDVGVARGALADVLVMSIAFLRHGAIIAVEGDVEGSSIMHLFNAADLSDINLSAANYSSMLYGHYALWRDKDEIRVWDVDAGNDAISRVEAKGLDEKGVEFLGHTLLFKSENGAATLCPLVKGLSVCVAVGESGDSYIPVYGDGSVGVIERDEALALYDQDGKQSASLPPTNLEGNVTVSFNSRCNSAYIWTRDGRVLRFRRSLSIFGRPMIELDRPCR